MNDPARLAQLNALKLAVLVREHVGGEPVLVSSDYAGGAALRHGDEAWVLLADRPARGLGAALAWALRQGASQLHIVAESGTGTLARRAAGLALPVTVWHAEGRVLLPAVAEPLPSPGEVPATHRPFAADIAGAGAVARVEHGVLFGEVDGLEVCRVVDDPYTGAVRLEVGVGAHDREAFQMLHGDRPTADALADVVRAVADHRSSSSGARGNGHPLSRLAKERALRARLVEHPAVVGATEVVPVEPPIPRVNVKDPEPCVAIAQIDGRPVLLVCTAGVDLDVVPYAIDARLAHGITECLLVMPSRDALGVQRLLAAATLPPLVIVPVD